MKELFKRIIYGKDADEAEEFLQSLDPSKAIPDRTFQEQLQRRIKNRVTLFTQWMKNIYHLLQSYQANIKYGFPAKKMRIIGITGTYGKTTVAKLIYDKLFHSGLNVGLIATGIIRYANKEIELGAHETTPEPWELPHILDDMRKVGVDHVIIEASSLGLDQHRLFRVQFDASVITNIDKAHLAYHKSWRNYAKAKFKLVRKTKRGGLLVLNRDHKVSIEWIDKRVESQKYKVKRLSIGMVKDIQQKGENLSFRYNNKEHKVPGSNKYAIMNKLMAIEVARYFSLSNFRV